MASVDDVGVRNLSSLVSYTDRPVVAITSRTQNPEIKYRRRRRRRRRRTLKQVLTV
jgi:hypothetical protein